MRNTFGVVFHLRLCRCPNARVDVDGLLCCIVGGRIAAYVGGVLLVLGGFDGAMGFGPADLKCPPLCRVGECREHQPRILACGRKSPSDRRQERAHDGETVADDLGWAVGEGYRRRHDEAFGGLRGLRQVPRYGKL